MSAVAEDALTSSTTAHNVLPIRKFDLIRDELEGFYRRRDELRARLVEAERATKAARSAFIEGKTGAEVVVKNHADTESMYRTALAQLNREIASREEAIGGCIAAFDFSNLRPGIHRIHLT